MDSGIVLLESGAFLDVVGEERQEVDAQHILIVREVHVGGDEGKLEGPSVVEAAPDHHCGAFKIPFGELPRLLAEVPPIMGIPVWPTEGFVYICDMHRINENRLKNQEKVPVAIKTTTRSRYEHGKWALGALIKKKGCPKFDSVVELIEYYQKHDLPGHLKMTKPVYRPKWLIKHASCTFDMQKDLIGTGNFCKVYKGMYEREPNDEIVVAIKICHGASVSMVTEESKQARESMIHEAHLMSFYVHKNVIQVCDDF
ncbi:hypothetical protein ANCDUO_07159 [Ancylostoma duodenale]|uniref:Protein kinase domain-containing protein n=1 Tax=Ancylostoma duodenale TaxID=51022 RepID=A0A0C2GZJ0_9BILA|nr:hypothetical protein ANCDUO_07159 [Ancylostoma duodenale]